MNNAEQQIHLAITTSHQKLKTYHSEVTVKMADEKDCIKFEQASGENVPPLWLTMMTIVSFKSKVLCVNGNPMAGIVSSCPNRPSSLLLLTDNTPSFGKHFRRSATNCSATHRETSHPVTRMSTALVPSQTVPLIRPCILVLMHWARCQALMRFKPEGRQEEEVDKIYRR